MVVHENKLIGSTKTGHIIQLDYGNYDGGTSAITSNFYTAPIQGKKGHEALWKDWRFVYVTYEWTSGTVTIEEKKDNTGSMVAIGTITAGSGELTTKFPLSGNSRFIQLSFTGTGIFKIKKLVFYYNLRGMRS
jgi:hypothetical protein